MLSFPRSCVTAIKLGRHTGRDCRYPEHREVNLVCPPWQLGSGNPCRNDEIFLNLMAVTLLRGNANGRYSVRNPLERGESGSHACPERSRRGLERGNQNKLATRLFDGNAQAERCDMTGILALAHGVNAHGVIAITGQRTGPAIFPFRRTNENSLVRTRL